MDESFRGVLQWVVVVGVSVIGYFVKRLVDRQDRHAARIDHLERSAVTETKLERAIDKLELTMTQHRTETNSAFGRIFERLDQIADRK